MGARNRGGIRLSYRQARLHRLAEFIPWNRFLGSINVQKYGLSRSLYLNTCAEILEQSIGARNLVGIGLSYRPARLNRQAESIRGILKSFKIPKSLNAFRSSRPPPSPIHLSSPEPIFVNLLRSPGIDSQAGGRVRQLYLTY
jgi:hypothetical protein